MTLSAVPTIVVAACHFGWGSLGKLRLVLEELPPHNLILFDMPPMAERILRLDQTVHHVIEADPSAAQVAVVINDPPQANALARSGLAVIYVDSLPFMWATADEIPDPTSTVVYCAQSYPTETMPPAACLQSRRDLRWIDPIVPKSRHRSGGGGAVVNVGGVDSHLSCGDTFDYVDLVLPPVLDALNAQGMPLLGVCGNIGTRWEAEVAQRFGNIARGPQSGASFERLLRRCDLLVTSPGSTTVLQAMHLHLPSLLLPPQNLSQILNTRLFLRPGTRGLPWPDAVMSAPRIESLRPQGEEVVVREIYRSIAHAAQTRALSKVVYDDLYTALTPLPMEGQTRDSVADSGGRGAFQVAQLVRQACFAPHARNRG